MFESFYKLHPTPFRLTPDLHFFFESETHKRGLAYLRFAFYQREGFVAITGAPGTGKTELTLNLIEELPHNKVTLAKIVTTNLDAHSLLDLIAESFQIDIKNVSKGSELKKIENFFISQAKAGKQVLLIIDEAHHLSVKSLLELSMLANFQLNEKPVMQCFLLGQLPLEEKLNLPELEHLKQRVIASARLDSLDSQETREYIIHRLSKSGWKNNPLIRENAYFYIHHFTNGVPRKINSLCNRLLLHSFVEERHEIDADSVRRVVQEMQGEAVKESLDLDFAELQVAAELAANSQHELNEKPDSAEEINDQQIAKQHDRIPNNDAKPGRQKEADHEVLIPAFLRQSQAQNTPGRLNTRIEAVPDNQQSQWNDSAPIARKHYQANQASKPISNSSNVAAVSQVRSQSANRPSGLLDKELQFLASLVESAPPPPTPASKQKPKAKPVSDTGPVSKSGNVTQLAVSKKSEEEAATSRKVIIDESVYGEPTPSNTRKVIVDKSVYDNHESVDTEDKKNQLIPRSWFSVMDDWRQTALAVVVVGSLIVSISWLFDGDSDPDNTIAENQSAISNNKEEPAELDVFAAAAPVDIELPVIDSANTQAGSTNEVEVEISELETYDTNDMTAALTEETLTAETPIVTETPLVSEITTAAEIPSVTDSASDSGAGDSPEAGQLDTQLTQILEKTTSDNLKLANDNLSNAATGNDKHKRDTIDDAVSDKTRRVTQNSVATKKASKNLTSEPTTTKHDEPSISGRVATKAKAIASKSVALQKNEPPTPSSASTTNNATKPDAADVVTGTNAKDTAISMLNPNRDLLTHRSQPAISHADLTTLLSRLSTAYETGNLQQLVSTFAPDINSSKGSNRRQMLREYQRLFNITDRRRLVIQDVKWSTNDKQILGKGDFEVFIREKGATKFTTYHGKISFAVAKESNAVVIKKLDYNYGQ